jgi:hypothetical protein
MLQSSSSFIYNEKTMKINYQYMLNININKPVGFSRTCTPVRCAHPSVWPLKHVQRGAARPPAHRSSAASYLPPKAFPQARIRPPGASIFPLGQDAPYRATLHLTELRCTLLSSAALSWATMHPIEIRCTLKAMLLLTEQRCMHSN